MTAAAPAGKPAGSAHATATAAAPAEDGSAQVTVRGAVLLHVSGAAALDEERRAALPRDLRAAVDEPRVRVGAELVRLLREGHVRWRALAAGVALAAVGTVVEAVLFRALFDRVGRGLFGVVVALLAALLALELPLAWGLRRAGAALEEKFRDLFMRKIPRLGDRYFQSRPVSDMAERAHLVHKLRALPALAGDILRTALEIVVIAIALVWLDPRGAILAITLAAAMLAIPLLAEPAVAERDLRMRNHAGALGRFYLDALLGLVTIRTHGAAPALVREHQDRLHEWVRAARAALRAALGAEALQALVGFGLAAWLLVDFFGRTGGHDAGAGLLAVYWTLSLPMLGYELALFVQQVPGQRSLTLRLVEPLGAPEEQEDGEPALATALAASPDAGDAVAINLTDVHVVAGGHEILAVDALAIAAGRARRDRRRIGRGEIEPGGPAAGLAPVRVGDSHRRRARARTGGAGGAAPAHRLGRPERVPVEPIARGQPRLRAGAAARRPRARDRRGGARRGDAALAAGRGDPARRSGRPGLGRRGAAGPFRPRRAAAAARPGDPRRAVSRPRPRAAGGVAGARAAAVVGRDAAVRDPRHR